jgi:hypothetical protein
MKKILFVLLLFSIGLNLQAQNKKKIKEAAIQEKITWKIDYVSGKEIKHKEKEEYYNIEGELSEIKEFEINGTIKSNIKYEYSTDGMIIKEIYLNKYGKVEQTIIYKYGGKLKTEKQVVDGDGKVIAKKFYEYKKR